MRYGLIVCSAFRRDDSGIKLEPASLKRVAEQVSSAVGRAGPLETYGFGSSATDFSPTVLRSPTKGEAEDQSVILPTRMSILSAVQNFRPSAADTLFFYYYGHAYLAGRDDIYLGLEGFIQNKYHKFQYIIDEFIEAGFQKVIFVLDTCHAGRQRKALANHADTCFGIFASGNGDFAKSKTDIGLLTESLLQRLDFTRMRGSDTRIDRQRNQVTFARLFRSTIARMQEGLPSPPVVFGNLGNETVTPWVNEIPEGLKEDSPARSIYRKLHALLELCSEETQSFEEIYRKVKRIPLFWLRKEGLSGKPDVIQPTRIGELFDLLGQLGLVENVYSSRKRHISLTLEGRPAADRQCYNRALLQAIETKGMPVGFTLDALRQITFDLMQNGYIPNAYTVSGTIDRVKFPINNESLFKSCFYILPYTGTFRKVTPDTIFPETNN